MKHSFKEVREVEVEVGAFLKAYFIYPYRVTSTVDLSQITNRYSSYHAGEGRGEFSQAHATLKIQIRKRKLGHYLDFLRPLAAHVQPSDILKSEIGRVDRV